MGRVFNFAAGPSMLPLPVLERAAAEMTDWHKTGMSVMEMSHRSKEFLSIFEDTKARFRRVFSVPENYRILFLQGGATTQFAMLPANFMSRTGSADYIVTGNFSGKAAKEARKFGEVHVASDVGAYTRIPKQEELRFSETPGYVHYCANNTIYGSEWNYVPEAPAPLCCDMSSNILSRPADVGRYALIYAGAQKNMAGAGLTVVLIRDDFLQKPPAGTPVMLDYAQLAADDSMYNTPPCYNIYILGLVLEWLEAQGGVAEMERRSLIRSGVLYDAIDRSRLFTAPVAPEDRSRMNVVFRSGNEELDARFVKEALSAGFSGVKGHRLAGGMRASVYNAMPTEGAERLADFIRAFDRKNA